MDDGFELGVCVVGVGFVGLTLSLHFAKHGIKVFAVDKDEELVADLRQGKTKVVEPEIEYLLGSLIENNTIVPLHVSDLAHHSNFLISSKYFIFTPGTPLKAGQINLDMLKDSIEQVKGYLKEGDLVIIRSTVALGVCNDVIIPMLAEISPNVLLAMCPERTIEGDALNELIKYPQIIGADNPESALVAQRLFETVNIRTITVSSLRAAELVKLVNNTYRDLMFAFANEISALTVAAKLSSVEIIEAANLDYPRSRIALPGPSGGPCLEKDPWILYFSGQQYGVELALTKESRTRNERTVLEFVEYCLSAWSLTSLHGILIVGLAFKGIPKTRDTRGSFARPLSKRLKQKYPESKLFGYELLEVDSKVGFTLDAFFRGNDELPTEIDVVILLNKLEEVSFILKQIRTLSLDKQVYVIDFWRQLNGLVDEPNIFYKSWG